MDTEVVRDLRERDFWVTVLRDPYDVVSELLGIFCGHNDHPSRPAETSHVECHLNMQQAHISDHAGWQLAGLYTDEGITGTSTKHREGFKQMITDALAGKIDLIITKSGSRFARNTFDTLTHVRLLKDRGVEVYFEKENIWTLDSKGELLITIMSSLAQEESRSISENVT